MRHLMNTAALARVTRAADDATAVAESKAKTVANDMTSRRIFPNPEEATAYLAQCYENFEDFDGIDMAARGVEFTDEGPQWDQEVYGPDTGAQIMVSKLKRNENKGGKIKAIVIAPTFTVETILAAPGGREWLQKIVDIQMNHLAVRPLRNAADVGAVVDQMPATLSGYISAGGGTGGGILATWDALFKDLNDALGKKVAAWSRARLIKKDFRKALESRGFAQEYYPALENRGEGKPSLFVRALELGIMSAKEQGLDPTIFERWMEQRNTAAFTADEAEDEDDFDLGTLAAQMTDKPATDAETPAAPTNDEPDDAAGTQDDDDADELPADEDEEA
jgi:hypothetical protein